MQAHGAPFYTWTQLDVESLMMIKLRISRFLPQEPYCLPHYRMPLFRLLVCICPIFKICSKSRCCPSLSSNNQWMVMLQVWFVSWTWSSVIWVAFVIFSQLRPLKPLFQLLFFLSCLDYCNSTVFLLIAPRTSISNYFKRSRTLPLSRTSESKYLHFFCRDSITVHFKLASHWCMHYTQNCIHVLLYHQWHRPFLTPFAPPKSRTLCSSFDTLTLIKHAFPLKHLVNNVSSFQLQQSEILFPFQSTLRHQTLLSVPLSKLTSAFSFSESALDFFFLYHVQEGGRGGVISIVNVFKSCKAPWGWRGYLCVCWRGGDGGERLIIIVNTKGNTWWKLLQLNSGGICHFQRFLQRFFSGLVQLPSLLDHQPSHDLSNKLKTLYWIWWLLAMKSEIIVVPPRPLSRPFLTSLNTK